LIQLFNKYILGIFSKDLIMVIGVLLILSIIIIPVPVGFLDFLLSLSIAISLIILFLSLYIKTPSKMTILPPVILILTLFRLGLNVSTTRSILGNGHEGAEEVSNIIGAFGDFVVGGNYVIGLIIFIILILVNFMVITKGAGRVAEVTARFNLDSLPGKQMAIDADLNAGFIDDKQAQERRSELIKESGFYGSLDGASKFVQGDAIFGLIVTFINIIGGILIGIFQHDMGAADSASVFTILTIGDGLVSQIPALITSVAVGIMITRSSSDNNALTAETLQQLGEEYKIFLLVGVSMWLFTLIPGFPKLSLIVLGTLLISISIMIYKNSGQKSNVYYNNLFEFIENNEFIKSKLELFKVEEEKVTEKEESGKIEDIEEIMKISEEDELKNILKQNLLEIKLGYNLLHFSQNKAFNLAVKKIRHEVAKRLGILIPKIYISEETDSYIPGNAYIFKIKGNIICQGEIEINKILAIPSMNSEELKCVAIETEEPINNNKSYWIDRINEEEAILEDYLLLNPEDLISKHITHNIISNTEDLLTRQNIVELVENIKEDQPKLVEDLLAISSYSVISTIIKELLLEKIPIINLITILETIIDVSAVTNNTNIILEQVRIKLFKTISSNFMDKVKKQINIISFTPTSEQFLVDKSIRVDDGTIDFKINAKELQAIVNSTKDVVDKNKTRYDNLCLIIEPSLRKKVFEIFNKFDIEMNVLTHSEVDPNIDFEVIDSINIELG